MLVIAVPSSQTASIKRSDIVMHMQVHKVAKNSDIDSSFWAELESMAEGNAVGKTPVAVAAATVPPVGPKPFLD